MKSYVASSFISKNAVSGECSLSALEVPRPLFAQGYIPVCGDALTLACLWVRKSLSSLMTKEAKTINFSPINKER
jgi:hypothetical protein